MGHLPWPHCVVRCQGKQDSWPDLGGSLTLAAIDTQSISWPKSCLTESMSLGLWKDRIYLGSFEEARITVGVWLRRYREESGAETGLSEKDSSSQVVHPKREAGLRVIQKALPNQTSLELEPAVLQRESQLFRGVVSVGAW